MRLTIPQGTKPAISEDVPAAVKELSSFLKNEAPCRITIMFAKTGSPIVGIYAGPESQNDSAASLIQIFSDRARSSGTRALQVRDPVHNDAEAFGA